jgi:peptidoglycan/LPS O-acetylase OafA/YrhL
VTSTSDRITTIPPLTSIRAFAAMGIVLLHFGLATGVWVLPRSWMLTQSLSVFFVLSGFILAYRYPEFPSAKATARYLVARIARIWPLHLFTLGVVALLTPIPFQASVGPGVAALNAFLLHAWVPKPSVYGSFDAPSFSLSIELFLYLCFPLLILGKRWTWILKLGIPLAIAAVMISIADRSAPGTVDVGALVYNHPLPRLWEFAVGVGAASVWRRIQQKGVPRLTAGVLEVLAAALVVANYATARSLTSHIGGPGARLWVANAGLTALPIAALLVLLAIGKGPIARALSWRPLVVAGDISYSTYLLHGILLLPIALRWDVFRDLSDAAIAGVFCSSVLVASYLSWVFVEVPGRAGLLALARSGLGRSRRQGEWRAHVSWKGLVACAVVLATAGFVVIRAGNAPAALNKLPELSGQAAGEIELVGSQEVQSGRVVIDRSNAVRVSGWAFDAASRSSVRGVLLRIDGRRSVWLPAGYERMDVGGRFGPRYLFTGFAGTLRGLGTGSHLLEPRAILYAPGGYLRLPSVRIDVS